MFGIFYAAFMAIGTAIGGIKAAIEEQQCRKKGIEKRRRGENFTNTYNDRFSHTRDIDTGKSVMIDYRGNESEGKDQYLRDMYGTPIRNLSEERRQIKLKEAQNNCDPRRTVIEWKKGVSDSKTRAKGNPLYTGDTYKDLKTGKIYVCRHFTFPRDFGEKGNGTYYMDVDTGLLVREADSQIEDRKNGHYKLTEDLNKNFIEFFNNKQQDTGYKSNSRIPKQSGWDAKENEYDYRDRMGDFYCNSEMSYDVPYPM